MRTARGDGDRSDRRTGRGQKLRYAVRANPRLTLWTWDDALAVSQIECLLKDFASALGIATKAEVGQGLSAGNLLYRAEERGKLPRSREAAKRTIRSRNDILHEGKGDGASLRQAALEAIAALKEVVSDIEERAPQRH